MSHASHQAMRRDMDKTSRLEKLLILKPKPYNFYNTDISYINLSLQKVDQIFIFWANQSLKLSRSTCFHEFKSSLRAPMFQNMKEWLYQKHEPHSFAFQKMPKMIMTSSQLVLGI